MKQIKLDSVTEDVNGIQFQFSDGMGFAWEDLASCHQSVDGYFQDPFIDTLLKYLLIMNWIHNFESSTGYFDEHSTNGIWSWKVT